MALSFYDIIYFFKISLPYLRGKRYLKSFEPTASRLIGHKSTAKPSLTPIGTNVSRFYILRLGITDLIRVWIAGILVLNRNYIKSSVFCQETRFLSFF